MVLLLLLLFNGFVLFYVGVLGVSFFKPVTSVDLFVCGAVAFVVVCGLAFLFHSPLGQWFLRLTAGARKTIERERQYLMPIIECVQAAVYATQGFAPLDLHIRVTDDPTPDAFAIGHNTLVLSRALYETASEDELAVVIAHELRHLHAGDSNKLGIALGVSVITLTVAFVANAIIALFPLISEANSKDEADLFLQLVSFTFMLFTVFFLLFVWLGNGLLKLSLLFVGKKQEYRADQFAVNAGFGAGLLSYLEKVKNFEWSSKQSLMAKLYATHPPVMLRIGEIEKVMS